MKDERERERESEKEGKMTWTSVGEEIMTWRCLEENFFFFFFSLSFEFGINIKKKYAYNFILFWYKNSPFS